MQIMCRDDTCYQDFLSELSLTVLKATRSIYPEILELVENLAMNIKEVKSLTGGMSKLSEHKSLPSCLLHMCIYPRAIVSVAHSPSFWK